MIARWTAVEGGKDAAFLSYSSGTTALSSCACARVEYANNSFRSAWADNLIIVILHFEP